MVIKDVIINNATGLHARPATLLVKKASTFKSEVNIEYDGKKANAKSLIGVLSLGVSKGANLKVIVSGVDEMVTAEEIVKFLHSIDE
jgi:phosphocarrier protein HPr